MSVNHDYILSPYRVQRIIHLLKALSAVHSLITLLILRRVKHTGKHTHTKKSKKKKQKNKNTHTPPCFIRNEEYTYFNIYLIFYRQKSCTACFIFVMRITYLDFINFDLQALSFWVIYSHIFLRFYIVVFLGIYLTKTIHYFRNVIKYIARCKRTFRKETNNFYIKGWLSRPLLFGRIFTPYCMYFWLTWITTLYCKLKKINLQLCSGYITIASDCHQFIMLVACV